MCVLSGPILLLLTFFGPTILLSLIDHRYVRYLLLLKFFLPCVFMENVTSSSTGSHILGFARLFVADVKLLIFDWMHYVSSTDVSIWISNDLVIVFGNFFKLWFRRLFICILDFGWMKMGVILKSSFFILVYFFWFTISCHSAECLKFLPCGS